MIFVVTVAAATIAFVSHAAGWAPFADPVTIPVTGVVAMCAMGVPARGPRPSSGCRGSRSIGARRLGEGPGALTLDLGHVESSTLLGE
ncbi:MAG: hypothetical protein QM635_12150, partial [Microbacteriaceae bacterium]